MTGLRKQLSFGSTSPPEVCDDVLIHRGVLYGASHGNQKLDVYKPSAVADGSAVAVLVHVHGGGWKRGGRGLSFYGSPALCLAAAKAGFVSLAPSYRLGRYPDFLHDVALVLQWVRAEISHFGGDPQNVFLSGHSAGGHIASLLLLRHEEFLAPLEVPIDFIRGLILVSGVYNLFNPMHEGTWTFVNKTFQLGWVYPTFGSNERVLYEASPLLLLAPETNLVSEGSMSTSIRNALGSTAPLRTVTDLPLEGDVSREAPRVSERLPPVLIFNAGTDAGLEADGQRMAEALQRVSQAVSYKTISSANHASICWTEETHAEIRDFIRSHTACPDE